MAQPISLGSLGKGAIGLVKTATHEKPIDYLDQICVTHRVKALALADLATAKTLFLVSL